MCGEVCGKMCEKCLYCDPLLQVLSEGLNKPRGGDDKGDHPPITPMRAGGTVLGGGTVVGGVCGRCVEKCMGDVCEKCVGGV